MTSPPHTAPIPPCRYAYTYHACRCQGCRDASAKYTREYRISRGNVDARRQREVYRLCAAAIREHLPEMYEEIKAEARKNVPS